MKHTLAFALKNVLPRDQSQFVNVCCERQPRKLSFDSSAAMLTLRKQERSLAQVMNGLDGQRRPT